MKQAIFSGKALAGLSVILFLAGCAETESPQEATTEMEVVKIWDQGPHNAFTDLLRFNNAFYCTFREGTSHVQGRDGTVRIIKSTDGKNWASVASIKLEGRDIRDPKLSVAPGNRIMVLMDVEESKDDKVTSRKPFVSFSDESGNHFSDPVASAVDTSIATWSDWVWRVTWQNDTGYAIVYNPNGIYLLRTRDGTSFENVSKLEVDGRPNESTIRFDASGKIYVLIRREAGDKMGVLATSNPPYREWTMTKLTQRVGGPNFIFLNDTTLCIGSRLYAAADAPAGQDKKYLSAVFVAGLDGEIKKVIKLPSGGDTSYPGLVVHEGELWYSYYSSHEGKTSVYLAKVPLNELVN